MRTQARRFGGLARRRPAAAGGLLLAAAGLLLGGLAAARADVVAFEEEEVEDGNTFQMSDEQLAQWVFSGQRAQNPLKQLENSLQLEIDSIATAGPLSAEQRGKLELAGRGDIHRFMDRFESLKRSTPTGRIAQDRIQEIWQTAQPLQARFRAGLHGHGSLFRRTVRTALDAEHLARLRELEDERSRKHYRAMVEAVVVQVDQKVPLTAGQRGKLTDLMMEKTEPLPTYGQSSYQFQAVLMQMSKLPEEDLRPIFLENEWAALRPLLQQGRSAEQLLRQMEAGLDE